MYNPIIYFYQNISYNRKLSYSKFCIVKLKEKFFPKISRLNARAKVIEKPFSAYLHTRRSKLMCALFSRNNSTIILSRLHTAHIPIYI